MQFTIGILVFNGRGSNTSSKIQITIYISLKVIYNIIIIKVKETT